MVQDIVFGIYEHVFRVSSLDFVFYLPPTIWCRISFIFLSIKCTWHFADQFLIVYRYRQLFLLQYYICLIYISLGTVILIAHYIVDFRNKIHFSEMKKSSGKIFSLDSIENYCNSMPVYKNNIRINIIIRAINTVSVTG